MTINFEKLQALATAVMVALVIVSCVVYLSGQLPPVPHIQLSMK